MVRYRLASIIIIAASAGVSAAHADTIETGGNVANETWTPAGSPYIVQGDITVPAGASLTIEAGTVVQFASGDTQASGQDPTRTELTVRGTLMVNGTAAQPVQFVGATSSPGAWYGLVVDGAGPTLAISNLAMANPTVGIRHLATGGTITTDAISINAPLSFGAQISAGAPTYNGVRIAGTQLVTTVGFQVEGSASPILTNCLSRNMGDAGIRFSPQDSSRRLTITNCTLHANGNFGFDTPTGGATITNSIITNHVIGVRRLGGSSSVTVAFSDVWNNTVNFSGSITQGSGNIASNPLYVSPTNLRLTANSPARFGGQAGNDLGA